MIGFIYLLSRREVHAWILHCYITVMSVVIWQRAHDHVHLVYCYLKAWIKVFLFFYFFWRAKTRRYISLMGAVIERPKWLWFMYARTLWLILVTMQCDNIITYILYWRTTLLITIHQTEKGKKERVREKPKTWQRFKLFGVQGHLVNANLLPLGHIYNSRIWIVPFA